ncbi:MAG: hypothetical protein IAG13_25135 [Deltaproteobacteria bacterium]|nr:hypothetical protein [Nannocystaceae bacterium]
MASSTADRTFAGSPTVLASSAAQTIVRWRCFLIVLVRGQPSVADVERMIAEVERMRDDGVPHCGLVHVPRSTPRLEPPPEAVRDVYRRLMNDRTTITRGSAVIVEQEGFFAAVVRSVVTSLSLLARPVYPTRALPSRVAGAKWLLEQLASHGADPTDLDELVEAIGAGIELSDAAPSV